MEVYEITGFRTGLDRKGVNFLSPADAFETLRNGFIYRQELKSRLGFAQFGNRLTDGTRVMGIFQNVNPNDNIVTTLVASKEFLYKYSDTTNTFVQIPFNSAVALTSLGISSNEDYVSGTTYPTKTNAQRFVFCSRGMSDILFYDGVDVKRFTNTTDNPDYQAPAAGPLTRATYISWFGERLNLFMPTIAAVAYPQAILYSGIRTAAGSGDKFSTPGSGMLSADTFETMRGINVLGDFMVINFQRSTWTLEKTRDAFNPYFIRKIPSVLGTDASFSSVSWSGEVKSIGKTGMITTDGRQSKRFDNNFPFFTQDDVNQVDFDLIYGGFDRANEQFLFAYRSNTSDLTSVTQDKVLVYNYKESTFSINDQRFSVFGESDSGLNLAWDDIDETYNPSWARMDETEEVWNKIGVGEATQKTLAGDNLGFIYEINRDFDDYYVSITGITKATSAVVSVAECALQVGDRVILNNVVGMTEINEKIATILTATTTSLTLDIDSTIFGTWVSGGSVSKLINFEAKMVPFNPYRGQGNKCYISHIEFLLNTNAGSVNVDMYEDEEQSPFKSAKLIPSSLTTKSREWITIEVNQESNFLTIDLQNESAGAQTIITSIRIHCAIGGLTTG